MLSATVRSFGVISRLIKAIWDYARLKLLLVIALGSVNVSGQFLVMSVVLKYAAFRFGEKGANFSGITFPLLGHLNISIEGVALIGVLSAAIYILSGIWYSGLTFNLASGFMNSAVAKQFSQIISANNQGDMVQIDPFFYRKLLTSDALILLRVTRMVLQSILPFLMITVSGALAIYIDPILTIMLFVGGGLFFFPMAVLNRSVMRASRKREEIASHIGRIARNVFKIVLDSNSHKEDKYNVVQEYLCGNLFKNYIRAMRTILTTRDYVRVLHSFLFFLILGVVVGFYKFPVLSGHSVWQTVVLYLFSLRFFASSSVSIAVNVTAIARLLPQFSRITESIVITDASSISTSEIYSNETYDGDEF